jgi:hypothetical protein
MTGRASVEVKGVMLEDAMDFLRESALVKEIDGNPALTTKGERFLRKFQGSSSGSPKGSNSPDGSSFPAGRVGR